MADQLLYTSAADGLKPGSSGYCTVEKTRGINETLESSLQRLSSYDAIYHPTPDPQNPVCFNHVVVTAGRRKYNVISRVSDYSDDYSGRSNYLAHHLVLSDTEKTDGRDPATILAQPGLMKSAWSGQSQYVDPLTVQATSSPLTQCTEWREVCGGTPEAAGWAGVLAERTLQSPREPIYILLPAPKSAHWHADRTLKLIGEALALLPPARRWQVTFSTFYSDLLADTTCQWRFVVEGSPAFEAAKDSRHGEVIDLTAPLGQPTGGDLVQTAQTGDRAAAVPDESAEAHRPTRVTRRPGPPELDSISMDPDKAPNIAPPTPPMHHVEPPRTPAGAPPAYNEPPGIAQPGLPPSLHNSSELMRRQQQSDRIADHKRHSAPANQNAQARNKTVKVILAAVAVAVAVIGSVVFMTYQWYEEHGNRSGGVARVGENSGGSDDADRNGPPHQNKSDQNDDESSQRTDSEKDNPIALNGGNASQSPRSKDGADNSTSSGQPAANPSATKKKRGSGKGGGNKKGPQVANKRLVLPGPPMMGNKTMNLRVMEVGNLDSNRDTKYLGTNADTITAVGPIVRYVTPHKSKSLSSKILEFVDANSASGEPERLGSLTINNGRIDIAFIGLPQLKKFQRALSLSCIGVSSPGGAKEWFVINTLESKKDAFRQDAMRSSNWKNNRWIEVKDQGAISAFLESAKDVKMSYSVVPTLLEVTGIPGKDKRSQKEATNYRGKSSDDGKSWALGEEPFKLTGLVGDGATFVTPKISVEPNVPLALNDAQILRDFVKALDGISTDDIARLAEGTFWQKENRKNKFRAVIRMVKKISAIDGRGAVFVKGSLKCAACFPQKTDEQGKPVRLPFRPKDGKVGLSGPETLPYTKAITRLTKSIDAILKGHDRGLEIMVRVKNAKLHCRVILVWTVDGVVYRVPYRQFGDK